MNKTDIFRVFDACQPTITQVKEYLARLAETSPFDLIFIKDGSEQITKKLGPDMGTLLGVVIEKVIFFADGFNLKGDSAVKKITAEEIFEMAKAKHPQAVPMNSHHLRVLNEHVEEYIQLLDKLSVFGYRSFDLQDEYMTLEHPGAFTSTCYCNLAGQVKDIKEIAPFLKQGNIFFCAAW